MGCLTQLGSGPRLSPLVCLCGICKTNPRLPPLARLRGMCKTNPRLSPDPAVAKCNERTLPALTVAKCSETNPEHFPRLCGDCAKRTRDPPRLPVCAECAKRTRDSRHLPVCAKYAKRTRDSPSGISFSLSRPVGRDKLKLMPRAPAPNIQNEPETLPACPPAPDAQNEPERNLAGCQPDAVLRHEAEGKRILRSKAKLGITDVIVRVVPPVGL